MSKFVQQGGSHMFFVLILKHICLIAVYPHFPPHTQFVGFQLVMGGTPRRIIILILDELFLLFQLSIFLGTPWYLETPIYWNHHSYCFKPSSCHQDAIEQKPRGTKNRLHHALLLRKKWGDHRIFPGKLSDIYIYPPVNFLRSTLPTWGKLWWNHSCCLLKKGKSLLIYQRLSQWDRSSRSLCL